MGTGSCRVRAQTCHRELPVNIASIAPGLEHSSQRRSRTRPVPGKHCAARVGPDSAISGYLVDPAMVRDVNSGVSALIYPNGRLLAKKLRGRPSWSKIRPLMTRGAWVMVNDLAKRAADQRVDDVGEIFLTHRIW